MCSLTTTERIGLSFATELPATALARRQTLDGKIGQLTHGGLMKRLLIVIVAISCAGLSMVAGCDDETVESCGCDNSDLECDNNAWDEAFQFETAGDIEQYAGYTSAPDGLHIWQTESVDLNPLRCMTEARYLEVGSTDNLASLEGLNCLKTVDERVEIHANSSLVALDGLGCLSSIGGDLKIGTFIDSDDGGSHCSGNPALTDITALHNVTQVGGSLWIWCNDVLPNVDGLSGITAVSSLLVHSNPELTNLNGLENLAGGGGENVSVRDNPTLTSLEGLRNITALFGSVYIENNGSLESLEGLRSLTGARSLLVAENDALCTLHGLESLEVLGDGLGIRDNSSLESLFGLADQIEIGDSIYISGNDQLVDLTGLEGVTHVPRNLVVMDNPSLIGLNGVQNLSAVEGVVNITGNGSLPYCEVCDLLDQLPNTSAADVCEGEEAEDYCHLTYDNLPDSCWDGTQLVCP
jgi:hypothetical protein